MKQARARPHTIKAGLPRNLIKSQATDRLAGMFLRELHHRGRGIKGGHAVTQGGEGFGVAPGTAACVQNVATRRQIAQEWCV